jgi:glycosyltransferase involved in cell wall biosynthesis
MRIALFFTKNVSLQTWKQAGMFEREIALYMALQTQGHEICFVTYGGASELELSKKVAGIKIFCNKWRLPASWFAKGVPLLLPGADVYKSNQVSGADLAVAAAKRRGKPFVARLGYLPSLNSAKRFGQNSKEAEVERELEAQIFSKADEIVVTTEQIRGEVIDRYKVAAGKVSLIPNYVEMQRFAPSEKQRNSRFTIGFVGRLAYEKNLANLIEAVSQLDVNLVLVGSGPLEAELKEKSRKKANIRFLGAVSNAQLPELLNSWDLFVLPSLYEGHPKALLEAMACELPVVGARVDGIKEIISDHQNGVLCEPDSESIRKAVQTLVEDEDLRKRLGKNGREFVAENFSLEHILKLETEMLHKVTG